MEHLPGKIQIIQNVEYLSNDLRLVSTLASYNFVEAFVIGTVAW